MYQLQLCMYVLSHLIIISMINHLVFTVFQKNLKCSSQTPDWCLLLLNFVNCGVKKNFINFKKRNLQQFLTCVGLGINSAKVSC